MSKYATPIVSQDERYLVERATRFSEPVLPPLLVKLYQAPEIALQLPDQESALATVVRRMAAPVADFSVVPALILNEQDLEDSGLNLWRVAEPMEAITA